ncbi:MAG: hypothetical protein KC766_29520, partial [Myxococcales bacterium]|nr:hypothetical protein [Myxococcales bacterium]
PYCQTPVAVGATRCWLCKGALTAQPAQAPAPARRDRSWLVIVILASLVLLLVGVQLWVIAPGLLVPYGVIVLPVSVVLARIAWVGRLDFWRSQATSDAQQPPPPRADAYPRNLHGQVQGGRGDKPGDTVLKGVAIGVTVFLVVIAILLMLLVAAVVIFAIICFASLP